MTIIKELVEKTIDSIEGSYSPYSKFRVGAGVLFEGGEIVTGANIENASYPAGICAERVAAAKGISNGHKLIKAVAIYSESGDEFAFPCGICRQFLNEFKKEDIDIYLINENREIKKTTLNKLLPNAFGPENLEVKNDGK